MNHKTAIIGGIEQEYHACSIERDLTAYNPDDFQYIGDGHIYRIAGVLQSKFMPASFWIRRDTTGAQASSAISMRKALEVVITELALQAQQAASHGLSSSALEYSRAALNFGSVTDALDISRK